MKKKRNTLFIAGPCAAESEQQVVESIKEAKKRNIDFVRVSLWKPRTKPGFDGLKEEGIPLLVKAAKMGVNPATEVLTPENAQNVIDAVLQATKKGKVMVWIGARNQNHYIQQEIASIVQKNKRAYLMVKNQPWYSEEHWEGIVGHVLHAGIDPKRLLVCHRGFAPNGIHPLGFRNIPDYKMAMRIRQKSKLPMIFDPSHTGGSVQNVLLIAKEALQYAFDGLIIEVHPNPSVAKTDAKQQLTWGQFDMVKKYTNVL